MNYINAVAAAQTLGNSRGVAERYAELGFVSRVNANKRFLYSQEDLQRLKRGIAVRKALGRKTKDIFVLRREGADPFTLHQYSGRVPYLNLEIALELYEVERTRDVGSQYTFDPNILLSDEVAARLRIKSKHTVGELLDSGRLRSTQIAFNRKAIVLESLVEYLGERTGHPLYNSREVVEELHKRSFDYMTLARFSQLVWKTDGRFGFQVQQKKNSPHLFDVQDIDEIHAYLKRPNRYGQEESNQER